MARGGRGRGQWGGAPLLMLAVALIMLVALGACYACVCVVHARPRPIDNSDQ